MLKVYHHHDLISISASIKYSWSQCNKYQKERKKKENQYKSNELERVKPDKNYAKYKN